MTPPTPQEIENTYNRGRLDGLEEAAKIADNCRYHWDEYPPHEIAKAIRSAKDRGLDLET